MSKLSIEPVKTYRIPAYPDELEVSARPGLLRRHVPPSWLKRKELAGATALCLGVGMFGDNGCMPPTGRTAGIYYEPYAYGKVTSETDALEHLKNELRRCGVDLGEESLPLVEVAFADDSSAAHKFLVEPARADLVSAVEWAPQPADGYLVDAIGYTMLQEAPALAEASDEDAQRLLGEQVKDFVDWLRGQGVI
jgi:hypothetical protein